MTLSLSAFAKEVANEERMTFDGFLSEVRKQNLSLKIESAKSDVVRANAIGVRIPAPTIGYTNRSYSSGGPANGVEVNQTIPFPGKISNDYQARKREAEAGKEAYLGVESEIFAKARLIYFNLWRSLKFREILNEKKEVIRRHINLTRAIVRSDSFLKVHLISAESDLDFLDNDLFAANQDIKEKTAIMAEFLNADPSSFDPSLEEPPAINIPAAVDLKNPHQLEAKKLTVESFKKREKEADSEWLPDFYLRYGSMTKTQIMPGYSEAMVGISLPFIFPWEPHAITQKSSASRRQAEAEYRRDKIRIETEITILFDRLTSLKKQLDNINQRLLPLAQKRLSMIRNLTPRDISTLQEYRETTEAFPDLKLKALEIRTKYEETLSEILKYDRVIK
jgi:outer membrane protein TolC